MLTKDLLRARIVKGEIHPGYIDPGDPALTAIARELCDLLDEAVAQRWRRGQVDEALSDWIGDRRDHKTLRGVAKIALDHADFQVRSPLPPPELRERVFLAARAAGPIALEAGPLGRTTADDVLLAVAEELGCTAQEIRDSLYADLKEQERIIAHRLKGPDWLLHRYNVGLVQALLLRAAELRLTLRDPTTPRLRQLARLAKFHQLMLRASRQGDSLELVFDGPATLLGQSSRYGMELASFFPAILLQDCAWELEATILWTKANYRKRLRIDATRGLRSHRVDTGAYETREQEAFRERFEARDDGWRLDPIAEPIPLGDRAVLIPDFTLIAPDGRRAHLDIVGYWTPDSLREHLDRLARYGPGSVVVAVSKRRRAAKGKSVPDFEGPIVTFAEVVPVGPVLEAAERVAR